MSKTTDLMPMIPAAGKMPAHLSKGNGLGNENVGNTDTSIPRISILQKGSPQVDEDRVEYVQGAKAGKFFNSVTNELTDTLLVLNVFYEKEFVIWKNRDQGGGFAGRFPSEEEANKYILDNGWNPNHYGVSETANHYLVLLNEDGSVKGPAIMNLSSSGLNVSRTWNANIQQICAQNGGVDRFAPGWMLKTVSKSNTKGSWFLAEAHHAGWATEAQYEIAKQAYDNIVTGIEQKKAA